MVSASNLLIALLLQAQAPAPAPLRLSFADAIRQASGGKADTAPATVTIAGFRSDAAGARVRQARASLLPNLSLTGSWVNRTFNPQTLGFRIPNFSLPSLVPPFNAYDGRARVTQTLLDLSSVSRVSAARGQLNATNAERSAVVETAAQNVALAYARAARAEAVVGARQADSALAAELVSLAVAQQQAGVSASIDVTRARTQLAEAAGRLIVAQNQLDRAKIDLARALGIDPSTPITLTDSLSVQLGAADVPADRNAAVTQAIATRPDLMAEQARGAAARQAASAISAERLPRIDLAASAACTCRTPRAPGRLPSRSPCRFSTACGARGGGPNKRRWCASPTSARATCASKSPPMSTARCSTCARQAPSNRLRSSAYSSRRRKYPRRASVSRRASPATSK
jgi:outer membrane protein TolC